MFHIATPACPPSVYRALEWIGTPGSGQRTEPCAGVFCDIDCICNAGLKFAGNQ
jgi:hypothetical protein